MSQETNGKISFVALGLGILGLVSFTGILERTSWTISFLDVKGWLQPLGHENQIYSREHLEHLVNLDIGIIVNNSATNCSIMLGQFVLTLGQIVLTLY